MNWRNAWNALWGELPTMAVDAAPDEYQDLRERGVSELALWEAGRNGTPVIQPEAVFRPPTPMKGVIPAGIAMDSCMPQVGDFTSWAMQGIAHEGLAFLGYPYLAQLTQRAEYRLISEKRAEHATRKWIKLTGPDEEKIKLINGELDRLDAKAKFRWALENDGFFGRAQLFLDFGDFDKPKELDKALPLVPGKISTARPLKELRTLEPMWSYPAPYESANPLAPDFYKPSAWYVYGRTIHDSRLLTFVGNEVPDILKPAYAFGGISLSQMAKPYVDNWIRTRQSVSDLVSSFSQMVLATDMESQLMGCAIGGGNGAGLFARVDMFNKTRNNRGTMVINKASEELLNIAVPLSGLHELQDQSQVQMCSVSSTPQIILLGTKEGGLGASNDDEIRFFYDDIKSNEQEHTCRPNLLRLLQVVQLSLFDAIDPEIGFVFEDLGEVSEKEEAEIDKLEAETDAILIASGSISNDESRERLANDEGSPYHGLTGEAPEPPGQAEGDDETTETSA